MTETCELVRKTGSLNTEACRECQFVMVVRVLMEVLVLRMMMRAVMRVVAVSDVSSDLSSPACQNSREFGNKLRHYRLICDRAPLVQLIIFPAGNVN